MRKTECQRCSKIFIEEHDPENFICDECWDKINDIDTEE